MTQQTLEQLRDSLAKLESGEVQSDLFAEAPSAAQPTVPQPHDAPAPGETRTDASETVPRPDSDEHARARAVVLRKLTGSAKTRHQLAQALEEKEIAPEVITQVLDRMEEVHLVNDAEFARTWVRTRHELKGLGVAALRRELTEKGVSAEHAEPALDQLTPAEETAAARELIAAKLRGVTVPAGHGAQDRKERDKITRRLLDMLARRGHSPGTAFQLVREELESRTTA